MKKITLLLVVILIMGTLGGGLSSVAFAATNGIETSDVLSDLQNSMIAGDDFDIKNYGYTDERTPLILSLAEYGFGYNKVTSDYNIYIYLYNPTGEAIKAERNYLTIATSYENGKAIDYEKFVLKLLSVSDGKYANLFYKFKVLDTNKLFVRVAASDNYRRYDVSEIELNYGDSTSKAFDVGNYYEYSGYAQGFGAESEAASTLSCKTDRIDVLGLDVNSTYFYYNNLGGAYTNLSSVFFGVPQSIFETYGKLQQIKANWFETHTERQIVINDLDFYEQLAPYIGISMIDNRISLGEYNNDKVYGFEARGNWIDLYHVSPSLIYGKTPSDYRRISDYKFLWLFHSSNGKVSPNEIAEFAKTYTEKFGSKDLIADKYSAELFRKGVDSGRQYGWQGFDGNGIVIDADMLIQIDGFKYDNKLDRWWSKLWGVTLEEEDIEDILPIYIVEESDLLGSRATISERLLVSENDVDLLKTTFAQNKAQGKKTILFRFAKTKYRYGVLRARLMDDPALSVGHECGYVAEQTAFLDFDIIWLKFVKEGQDTVIPCVSSPMDVFGGLTPPPSRGSIWKTIVVIIVVVVCLYIAYKLLKVAYIKNKSRRMKA